MPEKEFTLTNLAKLKSYWEQNRNKVNLNMAQYSKIAPTTDRGLKLGETNKCGTNCCLLGLAPEIFPVQERHIETGYFSYNLFCKTYFPYLYTDGCINELWYYVFHPRWPNNLDYALERIQNVIDEKIDDTYTCFDLHRDLELRNHIHLKT